MQSAVFNAAHRSGFQQSPLAAVPSSVASSLAAAASFVLLAAVASASPIAAPRGELVSALLVILFHAAVFLGRKSFRFIFSPLCFHCLPKRRSSLAKVRFKISS